MELETAGWFTMRLEAGSKEIGGSNKELVNAAFLPAKLFAPNDVYGFCSSFPTISFSKKTFI